MSNSNMSLLIILEIGLYFGPIFILMAAWCVFDRSATVDWRGALIFGVVLTVVGWVAMDVKRSVRCKDWEVLGYFDEDDCKSMYIEHRFPD